MPALRTGNRRDQVDAAGVGSECRDRGQPAKLKSALATALSETRRATVYGITFDFNKATLRPAAAATLGALLSLLQTEPALVLGIGAIPMRSARRRMTRNSRPIARPL
jgi:outer membrane protein OmpA-like peptidoglycan-associated protein